MKQNVDLTLDRQFNTESVEIRKHLRCEECGRPIQMPWHHFCLECTRFFNRIDIKRQKCYLQLGYDKRIALKHSIHYQFHDDRWYYSEDSRKRCRLQLTGEYPRYSRNSCRAQLRS